MHDMSEIKFDFPVVCIIYGNKQTGQMKSRYLKFKIFVSVNMSLLVYFIIVLFILISPLIFMLPYWYLLLLLYLW